MIGETAWTTDQIAAMLDCKRNNTTRRVGALVEKIDLVAPAIASAMSKPRPDRVASAIVSLMTVGGQIAIADPTGMRSLIRGRIDANAAAAAAIAKRIG